MSRRKLTEQIQELPLEQKIVFWGSVAMAVSVFMPWYSDIDAFRTGDTYYGITGPLYLIGLLLLAIGVTMVMSILNYGVRDKLERIFSKLATFYVMASGFCGFLLLLANSVYFHPKFGVNIAIKESRFGMILALGGVIAVFVGGYMLRKRHVRYDNLESKLEPLITMPEREHTSVHEDRRYASQRDSFVESSPADTNPAELRNQTIEEATAPAAASSVSSVASSQHSQQSMYRGRQEPLL